MAIDFESLEPFNTFFFIRIGRILHTLSVLVKYFSGIKFCGTIQNLSLVNFMLIP